MIKVSEVSDMRHAMHGMKGKKPGMDKAHEKEMEKKHAEMQGKKGKK